MTTTGERWIAQVQRDEQGRLVARARYVAREVLVLDAAEPLEVGATVEVCASEGGAPGIAEVLARPGTARGALYGLMGEHHLKPTFPRAVIDEAEALVANPGLDDPALEDWTGLPFVTIDNVGSRDLDQALVLERDGDGYRFCYALADASYYVRPGTELFREALARGSSYYFPGMSVPMLPRALSEGLVSLNEGKLRRALVFEARLDAKGAPREVRFVRALIRSRRKLTYDGVQAFHDAGCAGELADQPFTESLRLMRELGELLMARADERNVIRFDRTSAHIELTEGGERFHPVLDRRNAVERWNEQLSLLCNMEGSRLLSAPQEAHVQPIFKVHPRPSESQLEKLKARLDALVEVLGLDPAVWGWRGSGEELLADYIARLPRAAETKRLRAAVERQAMLLGSASSFSLEKGPHYGLAADEYGRFSSPMREIVGIFTHKELIEKLTGPQPGDDNARDEALREQVIEAGNRARSLQRRIERQVHKLALDQWFAADLERPLEERPVHEGTVLGVRSSRLYVQLDDPPLEFKIYTAHLEQLDSAEVQVHPARVQLTRGAGETMRLGDHIRLRVVEYDADRDHWCFEPLSSEPLEA